ncbi:putative A ORF F [Vaccinia virus Copenhagen]|uniref:Uncharacterized 8.4 kDa protein n=3 Tax=Vaccinia virus TaxID=10245 RepID=YVAF_VACCC|nr:RecName: Full=Uncharacterized 8.4 kDa protein [Vaccinia virus Copenhagen]AAW23555.1 hypothetical protein m8165R [Vaccinia virus]ABZ80078.1 unknown [synthetic Vaccinia virus]BBD06211.1 putative A ORF F [BAC cloning vector pLC16m8.8S-BAC]AAA48131.1 putative A ORF F [Vaccinia virus Copenhagen]AAW23837.1 hypothetical protein mO165R [Vaccinia virus]
MSLSSWKNLMNPVSESPICMIDLSFLGNSRIVIDEILFKVSEIRLVTVLPPTTLGNKQTLIGVFSAEIISERIEQ